MRTTLLNQKRYFKVNPRQIENLKLQSGLADLEESDLDEQYLNLATSGAEPKPAKRIQPRDPRALRAMNILERLVGKIEAKQFALDQGLDTVKEIDALHERDIMERHMRRCKSFRLGRPNWQEAWFTKPGTKDYNEADEECDNDSFQDFISEPASPRSKEMLHNGNFVSRMKKLHKIYQMRDRFDNCYAEAVPLHSRPLRDVKLHSKKVQTNVLELLGVDDIYLVETPRSLVSGDSDEYLEEGLDAKAAWKLINGVIDGYDQDIGVAKISNDTKKRRKRLTKKRLAEIPNFDIEEILGEFEVDNHGNYMIIKTKNGKLNDKCGRLVNRRGYLIDAAGNVITRRGIFIFYKEEIDVDDEIPAPFCFDKKMKRLFRVEAFSVFRKERKKERVEMQDEYIEREFRRLKEEARVNKKLDSKSKAAANYAHTARSSVESMMDETPAQYADKNRAKAQGEKDDDEFINQIVEPLKAKSKHQLLSAAQNTSIQRSVAKPQTEG